jgi:plasmid maintenance system antidote protein VapI
MTEFELLRDWLASQSGKLNEIARHTGISRRTIQRIVNESTYSVNSTTSSTLKRYMDASKTEQVAA